MLTSIGTSGNCMYATAPMEAPTNRHSFKKNSSTSYITGRTGAAINTTCRRDGVFASSNAQLTGRGARMHGACIQNAFLTAHPHIRIGLLAQ